MGAHLFFRYQNMAEFKCRYCTQTFEKFENVIYHTTSNHNDNELNILKRKHSNIYKSIKYSIISKLEEENGRSILANSEKETISVLHDLETDIGIPVQKKPKTNDQDIIPLPPPVLTNENNQYCDSKILYYPRKSLNTLRLSQS